MGILNRLRLKNLKSFLPTAKEAKVNERVEPSLATQEKAVNGEGRVEAGEVQSAKPAIIQAVRGADITATDALLKLNMAHTEALKAADKSRAHKTLEQINTLEKALEKGQALDPQEIEANVWAGHLAPEKAAASLEDISAYAKRGNFVRDAEGQMVLANVAGALRGVAEAKASQPEPEEESAKEQRAKEIHELSSAGEQLEQVKSKAIAAAEETSRGRFVNAGTKQDPIMVSPEWAGVIEELEDRARHEKDTGRTAPMSEGELDLPPHKDTPPKQVESEQER